MVISRAAAEVATLKNLLSTQTYPIAALSDALLSRIEAVQIERHCIAQCKDKSVDLDLGCLS